MLKENENFKEKKHLGFTTREEFMRDAARWRLKFLSENSEYVEIPKDKYDRLKTAIEEMNTPFHSASDIIKNKLMKYWKNTINGLKKKRSTKDKTEKRLKGWVQQLTNMSVKDFLGPVTVVKVEINSEIACAVGGRW